MGWTLHVLFTLKFQLQVKLVTKYFLKKCTSKFFIATIKFRKILVSSLDNSLA